MTLAAVDTVAIVPAIGVRDGSEVPAWEFAWQLPPEQGSWIVTCKHRHSRPVAASSCLDRLHVAHNGQGWRPLGITPAP